MPTDPRARHHPHAVFYGDSIVTGWRGMTRPRARWPSIVSDRLGWRETTLALNGMGYFRRRGPRDASGELTPSATDTTLLDAAIRLAPDVVVVCLAANDLQFVESHPHDVRAGIDRDLDRLGTELPDTPVVVTTYFPVVDLSPRGLLLLEWVTSACASRDITYVEAFRRAIDGAPDLLCDDGVHPNDAGHLALAEAILPALRELGL